MQNQKKKKKKKKIKNKKKMVRGYGEKVSFRKIWH